MKEAHEIRGGAPGYISRCVVFFYFAGNGGAERGESTGAGKHDRSI